MSNSEMKRSVKSLEVTKRAKEYLPSFYNRAANRSNSKNLAWCMQGVPPELLAAFDLPWEWPENFGTLCAAKLVATGFIEVAETEGFSRELCSYVLNTMGYCQRSKELNCTPPESPLAGGMGKPTLMLGSGMTCEPRYKWFQTIATRYIDAPVFSSEPLSPPYDVDINDPRIEDHYLSNLRRDIAAQVSFLETQTGIKFDHEKFRRIMGNSLEAERCWYEALELCKAVPSPMGAADYFTAMIPQMYMLGSEEAVSFYKSLHEEVKGRVKNGTGVIKDEKFRLLWMGIPPWFNLGLFNYLENLGVVFPIISTYYVGKPVEGLDLSDPLETLVQRTWGKVKWYHEQGTEAMPEICNVGISTVYVGRKKFYQWIDEYKLDGAIMHRTNSCRSVSLGQFHYRNLLSEKKIPSLIFESDMADPRAWSDTKIKGLIGAFLEKLEADRLKG